MSGQRKRLGETGGMRRRREHGGAAMLLMLILMLAAATLGTIAVRGAVSDLSLIATQRRGKTSFYCAEAGLNAARSYFTNNLGQWNQMFAYNLGSGSAPAGYPFTADLDSDGVSDVTVTLVDDYDEYPPAVNNPQVDNNMTAIMVATCNSNTIASGINHTLRSVVVFNNLAGNDYKNQAGHSSAHTGNQN